LEDLLASYPEYTEKDKIYYYLGVAQARMRKQEEAQKWFDKLRQEFPASTWLAEIPPAEVSG
jgi:TolA-binding protein